MSSEPLNFDSSELDKAFEQMDSDPSIPNSPGPLRNKIPVAIQLHDGSELQGDLVIGTNNRLSDYLNHAKDFLVLTDGKDQVHILNRRYIVQVTEQ